MQKCASCHWLINLKRAFEKTPPHEVLPAIRYCSHPRHVSGDLQSDCPDYFTARDRTIPLRNKEGRPW